MATGTLQLGTLAHAAIIAGSDDLPGLKRIIDETDIRRGLMAGEFLPYYQPLVRVPDGCLRGVEALARWHHPRHGVLGPDEFMTVVERSGQSYELTLQIAVRAIRQVSQWARDGIICTPKAPLTLALNIFGTLDPRDFPDIMAAAAQGEGLDAAKITFELTEYPIENSARAARLLSRLRLKGFGLAIDDFGMGHSWFDRLRCLPFTELKIDRAFVSSALEDPKARAILEAAVGLARRLGLASIAEGVERKQEWDLLSSLGCDAAQGFWISPPVPGRQIPTCIKTWSRRKPEPG